MYILSDIVDAWLWSLVDLIERVLPKIAIPLGLGVIAWGLWIIATK